MPLMKRGFLMIILQFSFNFYYCNAYLLQVIWNYLVVSSFQHFVNDINIKNEINLFRLLKCNILMGQKKDISSSAIKSL